MRAAILIAALALATASSACRGDPSSGATPTSARIAPTAAASATAPKTQPTAPATATSPQTANDEVTGIVGSVNASTRTIQIDRLSGAPVTRITVDAFTVIRIAGGGKTTLNSIRVSDRIVAIGRLNDRKDALVATEITVQEVVPGGQPGG